MDQLSFQYNEDKEYLKGLDDLFQGSDIEPENDNVRLTGQILDIYNFMKDGKWRTLKEIEEITGHLTSSISAQLRNLRKKQFGSHTILKRKRGDRESGLFEYKLELNPQINFEEK